MACANRKALVTAGMLALALTVVRVGAGDPGRVAASPDRHATLASASDTATRMVASAAPCDDDGDGGDDDDGDDNS